MAELTRAQKGEVAKECEVPTMERRAESEIKELYVLEKGSVTMKR